MGRKADPARRQRVLEATVVYLERRGLAAFSLRPLAAAVGVSPRTLLYHFGSKERLLAAALESSPALRAAVDEFERSGDPLFDRLRRLWARTAAREAEPYLRLFFDVYAAALRDPERYAAFLDTVVDRWLATLAPLLEAEGLAGGEATLAATQLLALHHGCALDLLATGDAERVTAAYLARLDEFEVSLRAER